MIRITGDLGDLTEFRHRLEEIGDRGKQAILRSMAEESLDLVAEGFDGQHDPYGAKWKANVRGGEILRDKGHLRSSFKRKALTSNEFTIGPSVPYAAVHQGGATIHAKNTRRVEYDRRRPRRRAWAKTRSRSGYYREYWKKRASGLVHVVAMVQALTFKIGKQWVSKASVTIPQRMMVPEPGRLPAAWLSSYRKAFDEYMRKLFG